MPTDNTNFLNEAAKSLNPGAPYDLGIPSGGVLTFKWHTDCDITWEDIQSKAAKLEASFNDAQYQRDRKYPSLEEQADMQYWDAINGTTTWLDAIKAVKAAHPKPTGE